MEVLNLLLPPATNRNGGIVPAVYLLLQQLWRSIFLCHSKSSSASRGNKRQQAMEVPVWTVSAAAATIIAVATRAPKYISMILDNTHLTLTINLLFYCLSLSIHHTLVMAVAGSTTVLVILLKSIKTPRKQQQGTSTPSTDTLISLTHNNYLRVVTHRSSHSINRSHFLRTSTRTSSKRTSRVPPPPSNSKKLSCNNSNCNRIQTSINLNSNSNSSNNRILRTLQHSNT